MSAIKSVWKLLLSLSLVASTAQAAGGESQSQLAPFRCVLAMAETLDGGIKVEKKTIRTSAWLPKETEVVQFTPTGHTPVQIDQIMGQDEFLVGWETADARRVLVMRLGDLEIRFAQITTTYSNAAFSILTRGDVAKGFYVAVKIPQAEKDDLYAKLAAFAKSDALRASVGLPTSAQQRSRDLSAIFDQLITVNNNGQTLQFRHSSKVHPIVVGETFDRRLLNDLTRIGFQLSPSQQAIEENVSGVVGVGVAIAILSGGVWVLASIMNELGRSGLFLF